MREACTTPSNWRCEETLDSFLKKNNTIGIEGIDTRHLTRIIRAVSYTHLDVYKRQDQKTRRIRGACIGAALFVAMMAFVMATMGLSLIHIWRRWTAF